MSRADDSQSIYGFCPKCGDKSCDGECVSFKVRFQGKWLIQTPSWSGGTWTENRAEAKVFIGPEFFATHYPQFEIVREPAEDTDDRFGSPE